jgi:basic membrane protein A
MNKKLWLLVMAFVLALALVACGGGDTATPTEAPAPPEEDAPTAEVVEAPVEEVVEVEAPAEEAMMDYPEIEPVKIALVMPSTISDVSWSQSMYDSLVALQEHYGEDVIEIAYTENMFNVTDAASAIRDYADSGYNLVLAHGAQYGSTLFEVAPDYPETSFAWGTTTNYGADEGVENVFAYDPRAEEGGYVQGVILANLTESGIIGVVGPVDAGDAKLHVDGVVAGVTDTNPDAQLNISFTGSFGDTSLAAEAANTQIAAGADVLTGSSQQVVGAIGVAEEAGVPWLGIHSDQTPLAPEIVKAMAIYDWQPAILDMITSNQAGEYGGRVIQLTLANGGMLMQYADDLPADILEAAKAAEAGIIDGSISIEAPPRN